MDSKVRVLLGPPRWSWGIWALFGLQVVRMLWTGPSRAGIVTAFGLATIAWAWDRHLSRRALWLTEEEVVIANSSETHVVPKAGAAAALVREEPTVYRAKPDWDNSVTAVQRLYVIPGDQSQGRIQVEAAQGLTPRKLRVIVDELEAAFADA
ncbi:MAG: hypothetical protein ACRBK7_26245 [Acidimicrobiales bacterium]